MNVDEIPIVHPDPENILINIPDDELPTITDINDSPVVHSGPENIQIKIPILASKP